MMTRPFFAFAFGATLLLSACAGFQPMHNTAASKVAFSDIGLTVLSGQDEGDRTVGFILRQRLEDRMTMEGSPAYELTIDPSEQQVGLGLTGRDFATRFDQLVRANWTLTRIEDGEVMARGSSETKSTYSVDRDPFRLQTVSEEAARRAARDLADKILMELSIELSERDDL